MTRQWFFFGTVSPEFPNGTVSPEFPPGISHGCNCICMLSILGGTHKLLKVRKANRTSSLLCNHVSQIAQTNMIRTTDPKVHRKLPIKTTTDPKSTLPSTNPMPSANACTTCLGSTAVPSVCILDRPTRDRFAGEHQGSLRVGVMRHAITS